MGRLLLLLLFSLFCRTESACPYGGITAYYIDQCYVFSGLKTTWVSAESICQYLGGHLVSIQSDMENSYAARVLHTPSRTEFYIGAYVNGHAWEWSDYDIKFIYSNFRGTMTNNSDNVSSMLLTTTYYSKWNILSSNSLTPKPFTCQNRNNLVYLWTGVEQFVRGAEFRTIDCTAGQWFETAIEPTKPFIPLSR
ncbi:hypothetical protein RB195_014575 [Necator americanus]|uniref:C-type lectin domain-containing protein n=1 Tax=Necator americanus TaxID=51031 RepID=A0ABR1E2G1_NECAM